MCSGHSTGLFLFRGLLADQGRWFKLWCSSDDDPDLGNLSLEDYGRWCKLGTYVKSHGTDGTVKIPPPAYPLQHKFRVQSYEEVCDIIRRLPHVILHVSPETNATVSFSNWMKYQGDFSTSRVRKFREMKRSKRRREEKRGEEKKQTVPPLTDEQWIDTLATNPTYTGIDIHHQWGKARTWCETNHKTLSRRFFVNWLNRAERPMTNGHAKQECARCYFTHEPPVGVGPNGCRRLIT